MESGIYKIQSILKPERTYIGSAINISERRWRHLNDLKKNIHPNHKLQNHYNKYGESDLQFSILLGCDRNDLIKNEQFFIDSYNPYFNECKIAGSCLGVKRSEETIRKLKLALKGKIISEETKVKISKTLKGRKLSDANCKNISKALIGNKYSVGRKHSKETREKMHISQQKRPSITEEARLKRSIALTGRICSDETRLKISRANKGYKHTDEAKHKISMAHKGRIFSEETRRKFSIAAKNRIKKVA